MWRGSVTDPCPDLSDHLLTPSIFHSWISLYVPLACEAVCSCLFLNQNGGSNWDTSSFSHYKSPETCYFFILWLSRIYCSAQNKMVKDSLKCVSSVLSMLNVCKCASVCVCNCRDETRCWELSDACRQSGWTLHGWPTERRNEGETEGG